jgi:hypothetical protein
MASRSTAPNFRDVKISNAIPFTVHLKNCHFANRLVVQDARFERSLVIESSTFEKGFEFKNVSLKEDLILDADVSGPTAQSSITNLLSIVHVDGRTEIVTAQATVISVLKTGDLHIVTVGDMSNVGLDFLDVESLRVDPARQGSKVEHLTINDSHIHNSMTVSALNIDSFSAQKSEIEKLVLSGTKVSTGIDFFVCGH